MGVLVHVALAEGVERIAFARVDLSQRSELCRPKSSDREASRCAQHIIAGAIRGSTVSAAHMPLLLLKGSTGERRRSVAHLWVVMTS